MGPTDAIICPPTIDVCCGHILTTCSARSPQFPDETAFRDKLIVGLICCAVSIPFTYVLFEAFAKSNEPEFPECQLSWPIPLRVFKLHEHWDWKARPFSIALCRTATAALYDMPAPND